jgi:hypothetical protein
MTEKIRIGKLPPKYTFILNPYTDARFTRCPGCDQRMRQRKLPLLIHIDPMHLIALNYTCRYCPDCDLLIAHQDEIEELLTALFAEHDPAVIGNDYLVLGTVERQAWREGVKQPKGIQEMLEHLHDFKEVRTVEYQPAGWYPADDEPTTPKQRTDKPATRKKHPNSGPTSQPRGKSRQRGVSAGSVDADEPTPSLVENGYVTQ